MNVLVFLFVCIASVTANDDSNRQSRDRVTFNYGWKFRSGLTDWADPEETPPTNVDPGISPPESLPIYNDTDWESIKSLPHDALIASRPSKTACPNGCSGRSYLPRHVLWYRKTFSIPSSWQQNDSVWLEFEGSFRNTTVWLNGKLVVQSHDSGYTPFTIHLDETPDTNHTIAVFVDPDNGDEGGPGRGSGWWYEGGGLYRNAWIHRAPKKQRIQDLFVYTSDVLLETSTKALWATLHGNFTVMREDANDGQDLCADFSISNEEGNVVLQDTDIVLSDHASSHDSSDSSYSYEMKLIFPQLWSTARPYLYHVQLLLRDCDADNGVLDTVSTFHGIRTIEYTANEGFFLNQQPFKIRGFCDHNTFGVVGKLHCTAFYFFD